MIKTKKRILQRWLLKQPSSLTQEYIDQLKLSYPEASISPRAMVTGSVSLRVGAFGQSFVTDVLLYGVEPSSLESAYQEIFLEPSREKIPVLASQFWGQTINELVFDQKDSIGKIDIPDPFKKLDAQFILGKSTFFSSEKTSEQEREAQLVGLSQKIHPLALAIPLSQAKDAHEMVSDKPFDYDEVVVKASEEIIEKIKKSLPEGTTLFGYGDVLSPYQQMGQFLLGLLIVFWLVSSLLVWVLLGFFLDLFWQKNQQAIFSLHALGLDRFSLLKLVIIQQVVVMCAGGLVSFVLFWLLREPVQNYFFPPEEITYWQQGMFASSESYWYWGVLGMVWTILFITFLSFFKIYRTNIAATLR